MTRPIPPTTIEDGWQPAQPEYPPVFVWPPRPLAALRWLPSFAFPFNAIFLAVAVMVWWQATPSTETMADLAPGWVLLVLARNAAIVVVLYGAADWWLYRRRAQADRYKFTSRWPAPRRRGRTFGNQTRETVFWTMASGIPIWTAWEVLTLWLHASGRSPHTSWSSNPLWFLALFPLVVVFREVHFYSVHRLIHVPVLYKRVHSLHHRNTNPSPWSGLSMHPGEHLVYFSCLALHWVVASHPLHILFMSMHVAISPLPGHAGFDRFELGRRRSIETNSYAHYLHHKLFEVNYADGVLPLDKWFGSFHDGTPEADDRLRNRRLGSARRSGR